VGEQRTPETLFNKANVLFASDIIFISYNQIGDILCSA